MYFSTPGQCCDEGKSFLSEVPNSPAAKAYADIIEGLILSLSIAQHCTVFSSHTVLVKRCQAKTVTIEEDACR